MNIRKSLFLGLFFATAGIINGMEPEAAAATAPLYLQNSIGDVVRIPISLDLIRLSPVLNAMLSSSLQMREGSSRTITLPLSTQALKDFATLLNALSEALIVYPQYYPVDLLFDFMKHMENLGDHAINLLEIAQRWELAPLAQALARYIMRGITLMNKNEFHSVTSLQRPLALRLISEITTPDNVIAILQYGYLEFINRQELSIDEKALFNHALAQVCSVIVKSIGDIVHIPASYTVLFNVIRLPQYAFFHEAFKRALYESALFDRYTTSLAFDPCYFNPEIKINDTAIVLSTIDVIMNIPQTILFNPQSNTIENIELLRVVEKYNATTLCGVTRPKKLILYDVVQHAIVHQSDSPFPFISKLRKLQSNDTLFVRREMNQPWWIITITGPQTTNVIGSWPNSNNWVDILDAGPHFAIALSQVQPNAPLVPLLIPLNQAIANPIPLSSLTCNTFKLIKKDDRNVYFVIENNNEIKLFLFDMDTKSITDQNFSLNGHLTYAEKFNNRYIGLSAKVSNQHKFLIIDIDTKQIVKEIFLPMNFSHYFIANSQHLLLMHTDIQAKQTSIINQFVPETLSLLELLEIIKNYAAF